MERIYQNIALNHLKEHRQMLFLMGPRQVGKSTICRQIQNHFQNSKFYNWDDERDREKILNGLSSIAADLGFPTLSKIPLVIFDEIHKYRRWKLLLKGFYDSYSEQAKILVTGSARLDVYRRGGDSLMGRYFYYRIHPLSIAELLDPDKIPNELISAPKQIPDEQFQALWKFGGFPDPFLKQNDRFYNQWKRLRYQQLFKEDLRDLTQVQAIDQLEMMAEMIRRQVGQLVTYDSLAKKVRVADTTIRNWIKILKSVFYCFELRPWHKNVNKALRKEPKYYLWDWSLCPDEGSRAENFVASHLFKAVNFWTDHGFGEFNLYFVRDTAQREVDFIITKDDTPWFMVEVKYSNNKGISPSLQYFHSHIKPKHSFQIVIDEPYIEADCFSITTPVIVPAKTLLSQLF